jgi:hypothetical protein
MIKNRILRLPEWTPVPSYRVRKKVPHFRFPFASPSFSGYTAILVPEPAETTVGTLILGSFACRRARITLTLTPFLEVFLSSQYTGFVSQIYCKVRAANGVARGRRMLINRDFVGHMATEVIKKLGEGELVEVRNALALTQRVRQAMMDEITVEDRISEEARQILTQHQDQMRSTGVSYQEMFKKVKSQLARDRKLVLR